MIKNCLFAVALASLALAGGCAKGGNGIVPPPPTIDVSITSPKNINSSAIYPTQSVTVTATVSNSTTTAVTWSLGPTATCTGTPNPCGTLTPDTPAPTPATAKYVAPATPISGVIITATLAADSSKTGSLSMRVIPVSVVVTPTAVTVGQNLVQQFTAIALPDDAPQTFSWTCTPTGSCGTLATANPSNVAAFTAPSANGPVVVAATSTVAQSSPGVGQAKVTVATSRLPSGTYAFQFSGSDSSSNAVAVAGSVTVGTNGKITGGVEDVVINGVYTQYTTVSGSYVPSPNDSNNISNNLGTLTLIASGGPTYTCTAVLTSSGIIRMIESDGAGTGSGVLRKSAANTVFNAGAQTFVFGFTGADSTGHRVGHVGMLPMTPSGTGGTISGGLLDVNDNGSNACGSTPCNVTGTYQLDGSIPGLWHMTLNSVTTLDFDFFVAAGQTTNAPNPLTLYAVSTDSTYEALSGSMVYQFPMTYDNLHFTGTSVSNLTGANANVSLTLGTTDGTSSGTGGTGGFTGVFDQNNDGTILLAASFPAASQSTSPYTYVATNSNTGRYIFQMLGDPTKSTPVLPIPFVLYASGANRGFLLDQSSAAVMTGTMDPQPANSFYAPSEMPGTYAAATISNSDSSLVPPVVQNLLLTSPGGSPPVYNVAGTQNPGNQALAGTYTLTGLGAGAGTGTIALTTPAPTATSVIYAIDIDSKTSAVLDFYMMGTCTPTPPATTCTSGPLSSIMFAQQ